MRKNKTWEITLTNNSRLVANEPIENAVVYTTDTEAYLNFRVTDSGFEFDSATIAMLNKDDGSIVERTMVKEDDTAVYEIESDIIPHFGLWQAQVLFKQGEEIFTSTPVKFVIERYMGAEQPPRLEDVINWQNLYDNAVETIQDLTRIQDELVNTNQIIEQAESIRQSEFNTAQTERQEDFNTAQSEKQTQFNANESERQNQFDEAQSTRQADYEQTQTLINEAESLRVQAETERATAESERESAEEQRKTDHANRSAELDSKADKKQEDWITPTLLNDFTGDVRYRKTQFNHLEIYGKITSTEPINQMSLVIFKLPLEYRPAKSLRFEAPEDAFYSFRNARMAYLTYGNEIRIYSGQGGSSWHINISIPMD